MDMTHYPMAVLDASLSLLYRNRASDVDEVFGVWQPGEPFPTVGEDRLTVPSERARNRAEFFEECIRHGGPLCFSETMRLRGMDVIVFWVCLRISSESGDGLLVLGVSDAFRHPETMENRQTACATEFRVPLSVIAGEAESLSENVGEPDRTRARTIMHTARRMLERLNGMSHTDPVIGGPRSGI